MREKIEKGDVPVLLLTMFLLLLLLTLTVALPMLVMVLMVEGGGGRRTRGAVLFLVVGIVDTNEFNGWSRGRKRDIG